jgi:hypothetical protein
MLWKQLSSHPPPQEPRCRYDIPAYVRGTPRCASAVDPPSCCRAHSTRPAAPMETMEKRNLELQKDSSLSHSGTDLPMPATPSRCALALLPLEPSAPPVGCRSTPLLSKAELKALPLKKQRKEERVFEMAARGLAETEHVATVVKGAIDEELRIPRSKSGPDTLRSGRLIRPTKPCFRPGSTRGKR